MNTPQQARIVEPDALPIEPEPPDGANADIPLTWIEPSGFNPRRAFAQAQLEELAASIATHGLLQPLVVRERVTPAGQPPIYQIIAGERRYRASLMAGLQTVPARVLVGIDDDKALELALVENLQREDLDPIEEAEALALLRDRLHLRQTSIAAAVKRSQPRVARSLALLKLPEPVQARIRAGELTASHGEVLQRWQEYPALQAAIAAYAAAYQVPTRALEEPLAGQHDLVKELVRAKLVRELSSYGVHDAFDTTICRTCPLGAYRAPAGYYPAVCLRPDHYDQLTREAEDARTRATAAAVEQARMQGKEGVPKLADLRWDSYERLDRVRPVGCAETCPCFTQALDAAGYLVPLCLDPACHRRLKMAAARMAGKERRQVVRTEQEALVERLDALQAVSSRELAVVVHEALTNVPLAILRAVVAQRAPHVAVDGAEPHRSDRAYGPGGARSAYPGPVGCRRAAPHQS